MAPGLVAVGAPTLRAIRATTPTPPAPRLAIAHRSRTTVMAGEPVFLHTLPLGASSPSRAAFGYSQASRWEAPLGAGGGPAPSSHQGPKTHMVAGEGFEPSK